MTDVSVKTRLADAMAQDFERDLIQDGVAHEKIQVQIKRSKERMSSAPVAILVCLDLSGMDPYPDQKRQQAERTMATQSVAAAGLQLLLAAHAEGLGGVWVCSPLFAQETIHRTLNLPESWEPQGIFYLGYPDLIPDLRERTSIESISLFL
jgi:F420 biosynthesis protein FbiB-like protein